MLQVCRDHKDVSFQLLRFRCCVETGVCSCGATVVLRGARLIDGLSCSMAQECLTESVWFKAVGI